MLSDVQDVLVQTLQQMFSMGLRLLTPSKTFVRRKAAWLAGAELSTITNSKKAGYFTKMQAW
ncbi:hypothetical protein J18TS1_35890 [Oceanobacillus oncorhynchi subsp. incaldanensis]|nr:hypothetical protein J18TS1_35890 [Oceanobacillus oncorhynchi subsp. incaldanensis]